MLAVVPDRRSGSATTRSTRSSSSSPRRCCRPACRACACCGCCACSGCCAWPSSRARSSRCEGLHYAMLLAVLTVIGGGALFVAFEKHAQHLNDWDGIYWAVTTMTTLGSNIYPTTTGGEIVSVVILIVGIGFVALLTGAFAQRFLGPEIAEVEEELAAEQVSAEAIALRELQQRARTAAGARDRGRAPGRRARRLDASAQSSASRARRSSPPAPPSRRGRAAWSRRPAPGPRRCRAAAGA